MVFYPLFSELRHTTLPGFNYFNQLTILIFIYYGLEAVMCFARDLHS